MSEKFCKHLSNAAFFQEKNGNIFYQPCCWVPTDTIPIHNKTDLLLSKKRIEIKVLGNKEENCSQCINREQHPFSYSHRQTINEIVPDDAMYGDIYNLSVQIDNTCNAACVTCGPKYSSLWQKQIDPNAKLRDFSSQYEALLNSTDLDKLRKILFAGGEPFLSKHNIDVLNHTPYPEKVLVIYNTNGSVFPEPELIELWKSFQKIKIILSIDGTEDQFEYIRWPLKWNKIISNIERFKQLQTELNISFRVNLTINPLNIFYYDRIEDWCNKYSIPIHTSACYGIWGIDSTPSSLRQYIEEKYGSTHRLVHLLRAHPEVHGKFSDLLVNATELDIARGLNHKLVFGEVLKIITR